MIIYDTMKCTQCEECYRGKFKLTIDGYVTCIDCINKVYLEKVQFKTISRASKLETKSEERMLVNLYTKFLEKDLQYVYNTDYAYGESFNEILFNGDGELNLESFYYQNNPIDIVIDYHNLSYKGFVLLGQANEEITKTATSLLTMYKVLRVRTLTDTELDEYRVFLKSSTTLRFKAYTDKYSN